MSHASPLSVGDASRIVEMAWQDHIPFEALQQQFGLNEPAVIALMRNTLKKSSFRLWRTRVSGRASKHARRASPTACDAAHAKSAAADF